MIKELFVIIMVLTDGESVVSINHATAHQNLNVFETLRECETQLPRSVSAYCMSQKCAIVRSTWWNWTIDGRMWTEESIVCVNF